MDWIKPNYYIPYFSGGWKSWEVILIVIGIGLLLYLVVRSGPALLFYYSPKGAKRRALQAQLKPIMDACEGNPEKLRSEVGRMAREYADERLLEPYGQSLTGLWKSDYYSTCAFGRELELNDIIKDLHQKKGLQS